MVMLIRSAPRAIARREIPDAIQAFEILVLRPDSRFVHSRGRQDCTIRERKFQLDAQPGSFERQIGIEIDYQTLSHLTDHVERGVLSLLAEHSFEDFENADRRNHQALHGENSRLKSPRVLPTVDVFEPARRIDDIGSGSLCLSPGAPWGRIAARHQILSGSRSTSDPTPR
jgi:hypothetical protein